MLQHGVNLVFSGHVHAYERSYPVALNVTSPSKGITHIVVGDGGNREGHAFNYEINPPSYSAFRNGTSFGHGRVTVWNATHATFEWHINSKARVGSVRQMRYCKLSPCGALF